MNNIWKKILRIILLIFLISTVIVTFYLLWNKAQPKKVVYEIVSPRIGTIENIAVATGNIEPRDEVLIKPQISGIISQLYKEAGEMVKAGEMIARIKVIPEMGQLNNAETNLRLSRISLNQIEEIFKRDRALFQRGVVAKEAYELSYANYLKAKEENEYAQTSLEIIRDGIMKNSRLSSTTQVRSTITGTILDIPIKVGSSVIQANNFNEGTTIATVADMNDMIFRGNVDETEIGMVKEGMPVRLTIGTMNNRTFKAKLEYVSPKGVESNGAMQYEIKAAVNIPVDVFIRAGYSANAEILINRARKVLIIPENCIEFYGKTAYVYVLEQEKPKQIFEMRQVTVGLSDGINIEIKDGLTLDDQVRSAEIE